MVEFVFVHVETEQLLAPVGNPLPRTLDPEPGEVAFEGTQSLLPQIHLLLNGHGSCSCLRARFDQASDDIIVTDLLRSIASSGSPETTFPWKSTWLEPRRISTPLSNWSTLILQSQIDTGRVPAMLGCLLQQATDTPRPHVKHHIQA